MTRSRWRRRNPGKMAGTMPCGSESFSVTPQRGLLEVVGRPPVFSHYFSGYRGENYHDPARVSYEEGDAPVSAGPGLSASISAAAVCERHPARRWR